MTRLPLSARSGLMISASSRPWSLGQQFSYGGTGSRHRGSQRFGQPNSLAEVHRLNANHVRWRERPAESRQTGQYGDWVHPMRVITGITRYKVLRTDGQHRDLTRTTTSRQRIEKNQRRVAVEQVIAQMQAPDPVVDQAYVGRQWLVRRLQVPDDLGAETVVA
jgi:hypothetical protein